MLALVPLMVVLFLKIHRHYAEMEQQLSLDQTMD